MKRIFSTIICAGLLPCAGVAQARGAFQPPQGYVPDAKTAIRIAVAVLTPIYGEKQVQFEKPYRATLKNGIWTVNGSLPNSFTVGGTAFIQISKKDGRILFVMHTK